MHHLNITTHRKREILDITDQVETTLRQGKNLDSGVCHLVVLHTTAALTTADLDPGTDLVPDHILSALIGTSVSLLVEKGTLVLGTWQRVVLVELDGPRTREIAMGLVAAS